MPRGFAAARIWPSSSCTALTRPSDHGASTATSCPRRRRSAIAAVPEPLLDGERPELDLPRIERRDQVVGVPFGRVDRRLQVEPAIDVAQQHVDRPLLLLVAAGRAPREPRLAAPEDEARRERRPRPRSRAGATTAVPPRARTSAPACRAASRERGSSASSAASPRSASRRRGCRSGRRRRGGRCRPGSARPRRARRATTSGEVRQVPEARPKLAARVLADELAPLVRVLAREQALERHVGVAVQRVAVRERELGALRRDVHELGLAQPGDVEAREQRELLQAGGPLAPGSGLADGQAAVVDRRGRLERRLPRGRGRRRSAARRWRRSSGRSRRRRSPRRRRGGRGRARPRGSRRAPRRAAGARWRRAAGCGTSSPASGRREVQLGRRRPLAEQRLDLLDRRGDARARPGSRPRRSRSRRPGRRRAARCRSRAAGGSSRRTRQARTPRADPCPARARAPASGSARSSPRPARRPARRARAARRAPPTRRPPAGLRRARSGAARRPAARNRPRTPRRTRSRRARAPPCPAAEASQCVDATAPNVPRKACREAARPQTRTPCL